MEKVPVIIDCDPGVDDALAIILALHHPGIELRAVCSVTGNGDLENTTRNAKDILALCGRRDIPVYRGCDVALDGEQPETVESSFGDDGLGGCAASIASDKEVEQEHAVDFLLKEVSEHPGEITLFAIGPCTNIAQVLRKDPSFAQKVKHLIVMGGAKYTGNMSPVAEYNFWADPLAAKEVFKAGFPKIDVIGLDVTNKIALGADVREIMRIFDTPISRFIYQATQKGVDDNWDFRKRPVAPMHDVLTVGYLIDESILEMKDAYIEIETEGLAKGQSLIDIGGYWHDKKCNARYAASVDSRKFYQLFLKTVFHEKENEINEFIEKEWR
ncbi:MAG: nucleoside hydrolase [Lachnospiraceae bacterium]|jgi:purine nucleosidase